MLESGLIFRALMHNRETLCCYTGLPTCLPVFIPHHGAVAFHLHSKLTANNIGNSLC